MNHGIGWECTYQIRDGECALRGYVWWGWGVPGTTTIGKVARSSDSEAK